jgi:hypothetical protein
MDLKDSLKYAVELAVPNFHKDDEDREWSDKPMRPVQGPIPEEMYVTTLTGLTDLIHERVNNFDPKNVVILVSTHELVILVDRNADTWGRRTTHVRASLPDVEQFRFGTFQDHEPFLIGVLSHFTETPDRNYLVQIATHVESGRIRTSLDDGVSQALTLKQGASLKTEAAVKNRLSLAPYRTFRELEQPASEFLFRLRGGSETAAPMLALFEADGGKWKIEAMERIGRYLRTTLKTDIPVVI